MKIEFATGAAGFYEARELSTMARYIVNNTVSGSHDTQLLDSIEQIAATHMQKPEFADLTVTMALEVEDRPVLQRMAESWRRVWGPSRGEMDLSRQRIAALERAERAERSAFEALAEMARVARERDDDNEQIKDLRKRVDILETELAESISRERLT